jgi:hypothetical protein
MRTQAGLGYGGVPDTPLLTGLGPGVFLQATGHSVSSKRLANSSLAGNRISAAAESLSE